MLIASAEAEKSLVIAVDKDCELKRTKIDPNFLHEFSNFVDSQLKPGIDKLHFDGSKTHFGRRRREPNNAISMETTLFSRESTSKSVEGKWNKQNSLF